MDKDAQFDKYKQRGSTHLRELMSKDIRVFNAYHKARYEWIKKLAGDIKYKKVLDVGCGDGLLTYFLAKEGAKMTGIDNEKVGLDFAKENIKELDPKGDIDVSFVLSSAYKIELPDESFDKAVSCEVIEHLERPEEMLQEIRRVLKKDATLILTTPYKITEEPQDTNHVKEYYPNELKELVSKYFNEVEVILTHHMMYRSIYAYGFRLLGNRPLGKWVINIFTLYFRWNPFMIEYKDHHKFDTFATICIRAKK